MSKSFHRNEPCLDTCICALKCLKCCMFNKLFWAWKNGPKWAKKEKKWPFPFTDRPETWWDDYPTWVLSKSWQTAFFWLCVQGRGVLSVQCLERKSDQLASVMQLIQYLSPILCGRLVIPPGQATKPETGQKQLESKFVKMSTTNTFLKRNITFKCNIVIWNV